MYECVLAWKISFYKINRKADRSPLNNYASQKEHVASAFVKSQVAHVGQVISVSQKLQIELSSSVGYALPPIVKFLKLEIDFLLSFNDLRFFFFIINDFKLNISKVAVESEWKKERKSYLCKNEHKKEWEK